MRDKIYKDLNGDWRVKPRCGFVDNKGRIIRSGEKVTVVETTTKEEPTNGDK